MERERFLTDIKTYEDLNLPRTKIGKPDETEVKRYFQDLRILVRERLLSDNLTVQDMKKMIDFITTECTYETIEKIAKYKII